MPKGGKRANAGRKKGSSIKDGSLVALGPKILAIAEDWLTNGTKADQRFVIKEVMPYVFRKQPTATEISGPGGSDIPVAMTVQFVANSSDS